VELDIHTFGYEPLKESSWAPLPKFLASKKANINMKNTDNHCFKWCIARALNPVERDSERITKILSKQAESLNFKGIEFPMNLKDIDKFERLNAEIKVNVFGYKAEGVHPLRISKLKREKKVRLLLLQNKHYCLVKNFSRLVSVQVSKHHGAIEICKRCYHFPNKKALEKHEEICQNHDAIRIVLPEKGSILEFKNHKHSMRVPILVYADFESFTKPIDSCQPNPDRSFTNAYQKHEPSGFCFYIVCGGKKSRPVLYTKQTEDENMAEIFVKMLRDEVDQVWSSEVKVKEMILSEEENSNFEKAAECWIYKNPFEDGEKKVRDHCHYSGKFRGAAHNQCNLLFRKPKHIPVIFHNLAGYDSHLFIKSLGKTQGNIDCIPNNEEKYISFSKSVNDENKNLKYKIRFIDSLKFMSSGLDKLTNNLERDLFQKMKTHSKNFELCLRKGAFPYDWFDSLEKLSERNFPPKEAFFSKLIDSEI